MTEAAELRKHLERLVDCLSEAVEFAQTVSPGTGHNAGMWAAAVSEARIVLRGKPVNLTGTTGREHQYQEWRRSVDKWVWRLAGCSLDDLADVRDRDWFDDGVEPEESARQAIRYDQGREDDEDDEEAEP